MTILNIDGLWNKEHYTSRRYDVLIFTLTQLKKLKT